MLDICLGSMIHNRLDAHLILLFDDAREDTALDWASDAHSPSSSAAYFYIPQISLVSLYDFKWFCDTQKEIYL